MISAGTPVRPAVYRVKAGDTLYSIAWRFGLDHRSLADWNGIADPDVIFTGQSLRLKPQTRRSKPVTAKSREQATAAGAPPRGRPRDEAVQTRAVSSRELKWMWPAAGAVRTASAPLVGNRGLEIRGKRGAAVRAAASGQVVYSGSGLRGYGELIIIKHDEVFLSAYAHNEKRLVPEGADVRAGQEIAKMGDSEADDVMLHFEIRRHGKAVEPLHYLPKR
jgi:lipoprotein NlpD